MRTEYIDTERGFVKPDILMLLCALKSLGTSSDKATRAMMEFQKTVRGR